ncbi:MAG: hypothetical protein KJZ85_03820 [Rhodobacteraceae bacterium]|nr:hypothetical protein [Paracoccaceae bacterium]
MKTARTLAASLAIALGTAAGPVAAGPDAEAIAGALTLLGIAALSHNEHHYRDGQGPSDAKSTADFERGYRDALHGHDYDASRASAAYSQGYDAGHQERANRTPHRGRTEAQEVPSFALASCADIVAGNHNVDVHHVHVTRTVVRGPNDYLVETAVGHKYMTCAMGDNGRVADVWAGRIQ